MLFPLFCLLPTFLCTLQAGYELAYKHVLSPAAVRQRIAVVGSGPAGLQCAISASSRGHAVDLYEASSCIGGQVSKYMRACIHH